MNTVAFFAWAAAPGAPGDGINLLHLAAGLIALTALFSYLNHRLLRLPASIGVMALSLAFSLVVMAAGQFFPAVEQRVAELVGQVDFSVSVRCGGVLRRRVRSRLSQPRGSLTDAPYLPSRVEARAVLARPH